MAILLIWTPIWAKRLPPPVILPVDDGAFRFVVINQLPDHRQNPYKSGHVVAYLKATGEKIWEKYLFRIWMEPTTEQDEQDVYIKKMYLDNPNRLILQNEKGAWFVLERRTGDLLKTGNFKKQDDDPSVYYMDGQRVEPIIQGDYFIEADPGISYGHQKVRAYDLPTGRLLWEKKIPSPSDGNGGRSHISFMLINSEEKLEITFENGSECHVDVKSGKMSKISENQM